MNYLILNGTNSNTIPGLIISSLPPITKPEMRVAIDEIDGKDGDQITKLGYSAYDKEIEIGLSYNYDVNQVLAFFNTEGIVTFSNEPDKYYRYTIVDQIDLEKLIRFKTATVTMHVQPFKYELTEEEKEITTTETSFEGTNIQITGSEFGGLITDQKHKGQTEQKTYHGYNLLDFSQLAPTTKNGIEISYSDGYLKLNGTATQRTDLYLSGLATNWSTLKSYVNANHDTYKMVRTTNAYNIQFYAKLTVDGATVYQPNSFATSSTSQLTESFLRIESGWTFSNVLLGAMIEKGSTAHEFEIFTDRTRTESKLSTRSQGDQGKPKDNANEQEPMAERKQPSRDRIRDNTNNQQRQFYHHDGNSNK